MAGKLGYSRQVLRHALRNRWYSRYRGRIKDLTRKERRQMARALAAKEYKEMAAKG